jgi:hypothetical protein
VTCEPDQVPKRILKAARLDPVISDPMPSPDDVVDDIAE